jgi:cell shape-determining protein MreC
MFHEQMFKNNQLREELKKFRRVEELVAKSPPPVQHDAVVASVVGWDATNTARTVIINRGTGSGVTEGMVVLNHLGLVGRVVNATTRSARVLLITDARSAVDAYVQRTRSRCAVVGHKVPVGKRRREGRGRGYLLRAGRHIPAGVEIGNHRFARCGFQQTVFQGGDVPLRQFRPS